MGIKIPFYQGTRHSRAIEAANRVGMDKVQEFLGHTPSGDDKKLCREEHKPSEGGSRGKERRESR